MEQLRIDLGERTYPIYIGDRLLQDAGLLDGALRARDVLIVTNETVAPLYLEPLHAWVAQCGGILPGGRPLLFNIEAKTPGIDAYRAIVRTLHRYRDMLTVVRGGKQRTVVATLGTRPS